MTDIFNFIGLDPALHDIKSKNNYNEQTLELVINDDPATNINSVTHIPPANNDFRSFSKNL